MTEFKIENFFALPVRLTTHRCTRCAEMGRNRITYINNDINVDVVYASDGAGHFLCDMCLDELAMADYESLMEKIPEKLVKATFDVEEHWAVPEIYCTRCGSQNAIWTSRPKLGEAGFDLCDSCKGIMYGGIRGSMRVYKD